MDYNLHADNNDRENPRKEPNPRPYNSQNTTPVNRSVGNVQSAKFAVEQLWSETANDDKQKQ